MTSEQDRRPAARVSPVLAAGSCFEADGRPHLARMELPLSAAEMVAALYGEHQRLTPGDLATDDETWGHVAVAVTQEGLRAIYHRAGQISAQEGRGTLAAPQWLEFCRRRVAEMTGDDTG